MLESEIEAKVVKFARRLGWLSFKFSSPVHRAVPYVILMLSGTTFLIEFKVPGKKASKLQSYIHQEIRDHGIEVYVVDDVKVGERIVNALTI